MNYCREADPDKKFSMGLEETRAAHSALSAAISHEMEAYEQLIDESEDGNITLRADTLGGFIDAVRVFKAWLAPIQAYNFDAMERKYSPYGKTIYPTLQTVLKMISKRSLIEIVIEGEDDCVYDGPITEYGNKIYDTYYVKTLIPVESEDEEGKDIPCLSMYIVPPEEMEAQNAR